MIYILLNIFPIIVSTIAGLVFGAVYYRAGMPANVSSPINGAALVTTGFIAEFWLACILAGALILAPPQASVWTMSIGSAVIIWVGFVVPVIVSGYRLRGISMRSAATDCGHWLGVMILQAIVLRLIGLTPPPVG